MRKSLRKHPVSYLRENAEPEEIVHWVNSLIQENNGGPLAVSYHMEPDYSINNLTALHDEIVRRGYAEYGRRAV